MVLLVCGENFLRAVWLCILSEINLKAQLLTRVFQIQKGGLPIDHRRGNDSQEYAKLLR